MPGGTAAAAKKLAPPPSRTSWGPSESEDAFLRQQVSVLSTLRHDNLVRLLGYTIAADLRVLLFEFATAGTLHDALHGGGARTGLTGEPQPPTAAGSRTRARPAAPTTLSWAQRTRVALDAARGLQYLHEAAAVSHWGVRSTNVLLFEGLRAKIADYDVFRQPPMDPDADIGADRRWFVNPHLPPEYVMAGQSQRIPLKTDVYCFGVVLLELLTGRTPHDMTLDPMRPHALMPLVYITQATKMLTNGGRLEQYMDPKLGTQYPPAGALKLWRVALQCLHKDHRSRPSMGAVAQTISSIVGDQ